MGLFDLFQKRQRSLPRICYDIAYTALPHLAFNDCDALTKMFLDGPIPPGTFCYVRVCQALKIQINQEDAKRFREHSGELDDARDYFVLEYPAPPPVELSDADPGSLPPEKRPVLAPYFSAMVRNHKTNEVNYFTLGQAPTGGTTLRAVTRKGSNLNLGPGPEPRLDAFLECLRNGQKAKSSAKLALSLICSDIANVGLPDFAFNHGNMLFKMFIDTTTPAGQAFYLLACKARKAQPDIKDAGRIRAYNGRFDKMHDYFILEYPAPPPIDLSGVDLIKMPGEQTPVPAPRFSAVIRHHTTGAVKYFILEQAIKGGGTTLRSISSDTSISDLGAGPEPRLDAFLERLRGDGMHSMDLSSKKEPGSEVSS
jgi:hypothetical protein